MVSFAAGQHYFARLAGENRLNHINGDGTIYTVGKDMKQTAKATALKSENGRHKSLKVAQKEGERTYRLNSVKGYSLIHSQGYHATPILIVQNPSMPKNTLHTHKIFGMGILMQQLTLSQIMDGYCSSKIDPFSRDFILGW